MSLEEKKKKLEELQKTLDEAKAKVVGTQQVLLEKTLDMIKKSENAIKHIELIKAAGSEYVEHQIGLAKLILLGVANYTPKENQELNEAMERLGALAGEFISKIKGMPS